MRQAVKLILLHLIIIAILGLSEEKGSNAGVLPYTIAKDGQMYILLGEQKGFWIDFIGTYEKYDGGELAETATREFIQETNCFFDKSEIKQKITETRPIQLEKAVYRYIIEIPHVPVQRIKGSTVPCQDVEKTDYCWVNAKKLLEAVDNAPDKRSVLINSSCRDNGITLHKIMRNNLLAGTPSRQFIDSLVQL